MENLVSFRGYVQDVTQAELLFDYARKGTCRLLNARLDPKAQALLASGQGFIYNEKESEIKRWSDGKIWSDSSSRMDFLLYKECQYIVDPATSQKKKVELPNGLRKKTISDKTPNSHLRMVFYYTQDATKIPVAFYTPSGQTFDLLSQHPVAIGHQPDQTAHAKSTSRDSFGSYLDNLIQQNNVQEHYSSPETMQESSDYTQSSSYFSSPQTPFYPPSNYDPFPGSDGFDGGQQNPNKRRRDSPVDGGEQQHYPNKIVLQTHDISQPIIEVRHPRGVTSVYLDALSQLRVENTSKNADFAEYMEAVQSEKSLMVAGTVVNVKTGVASTQGFDQEVILPRIVSTAPLILGNDDGTSESRAQKVEIAMVGQVPIIVEGQVNQGDFLSAGYVFGKVTAVSEKEMTMQRYGRVVGIALESSKEIEAKPIKALIFYPDVSWLTGQFPELGKASVGTNIADLRRDVSQLKFNYQELAKRGNKKMVFARRKKRLVFLLVFACLFFVGALALAIGLGVYFSHPSSTTGQLNTPPTLTPTPTSTFTLTPTPPIIYTSPSTTSTSTSNSTSTSTSTLTSIFTSTSTPSPTPTPTSTSPQTTTEIPTPTLTETLSPTPTSTETPTPTPTNCFNNKKCLLLLSDLLNFTSALRECRQKSDRLSVVPAAANLDEYLNFTSQFTGSDVYWVNSTRNHPCEAGFCGVVFEMTLDCRNCAELHFPLCEYQNA